MANLIINGGKKLSGTITPSGNKNAVLPILCSTLLTSKPVTLRNVPDIIDVNKLVQVMKSLGSNISWDKDKSVMHVKNDRINVDSFDGNFPLDMRSSILFFGPLTSRLKKVSFSTEIKGCSLGIREVDTHIDALKCLGAQVEIQDNLVNFKIQDRFRGNNHWPYYISVTTTENFIMAAVLAKGTSILMNAASEPHVQELCTFLNSIGADIKGIGSSKLKIRGVDQLEGTEYTIGSDHHEITTFLALGAMTGGKIVVNKVSAQHFPLIISQFKKLGVEIEMANGQAIVEENQKMEIVQPYTKNMITKIECHPWPYFPVDLIPLLMALATKSKGQIMFWNKMYEGANLWVPKLMSFGAKVLLCDPHRVLIWGGIPLKPAVVDAPDIIRATVALFMVAQSVKGKSIINNAGVIKRAHPGFVDKMVTLGADVEWEE
ncbi:MAG: UDP-N-acetylglucosamine 1-carboxyvinyltransferase [Patescibacteria group bacterium]|nr:UDP-N-acetylglucosamine 1-carboxyvinyltransferase [Patescibacteria group bacterium]